MYSFAFPDDPIVTGLIMDSGTALLQLARGDGTGESFSYVAAQVGCAGLANDTAAQISCMRSIPADVIQDFIANHTNRQATPVLAFGPIPDERTIFANYTDRYLSGKQANLPAIIGTAAQDGVPFTGEPYSPDGPDAAAAQVALLSIFVCPATETIRLRRATGKLAYSYQYSGNFSKVSPRLWSGAYYSSELPLIMGTHPNYRGPSTQLEYATSYAMQDDWVAFARDPSNGLVRRGWPLYDQLGAAQIRQFGAGVPSQNTSLSTLEVLCDGAALAS